MNVKRILALPDTKALVLHVEGEGEGIRNHAQGVNVRVPFLHKTVHVVDKVGRRALSSVGGHVDESAGEVRVHCHSLSVSRVASCGPLEPCEFGSVRSWTCFFGRRRKDDGQKMMVSFGARSLCFECVALTRPSDE